MPAKLEQEVRPISSNLQENRAFLDDVLGIGIGFDIAVHELVIGEKKALLYYINGLVDSNAVTLILADVNNVNKQESKHDLFAELFHKFIPYFQLTKVKDTRDFIDNLLIGQVCLLIDGENQAIVLDVKLYPGRTPEEPDTERVVRGSHDGFTESLVTNTALTRRRLRDERLRFEITRVGKRSKTDVAIAYIHDVANPQLVEDLKQRLKQIDVDGLPMGEKTIEEFMIRKWWNPYPLVRYTERPDVAVIHLLEGHILIYVDTSPSVIITPTTFFHHVQHAEEYRQVPVVGAYLRWIRFIGILASLLLLPLWLLCAESPSFLPDGLSYIGTSKEGKVPLLIQFILAEVGIDLMRMAAVHTPTPLATAMGLVAAILIGEVAIKVGLFSPEVILYLAIAAIGTFATPSYELGLANRIIRLVLLILTGLFSASGFVLGLAALFVLLALTRSLNTPYLWPFLPFNYQALRTVIIRMAFPYAKRRPSIVRPQNPYRQ